MPDRTIATLELDTTHGRHPLRRLNGVNGAGVSGNYWLDLTPWYRRWQIPVVRLHDAPFDAHNTVDLHHLFPDPMADPDDPASYQFPLTDDLLRHLRNAGMEIYFRLGESIEHQPRLIWNSERRWDPAALARVCANIVRHYNQGWADGYRWGIRDWEFWNEPHGPKNWDGTPEEFFARYALVARAVKAADADVRIGLAGLAANFVQPGSPWGQGIASLAANDVPVDFVSWHSYLADLRTISTASRAVRRFLDEAGLAGVESHLGEWSLRPTHGPDGAMNIFSAYKAHRYDHVARLTEEMQGAAGLAHTLGGLLLMQSEPIDQAHYYTANTSARWGLFDGNGQPTLRGLAFDIFAGLLRLADDHWALTVDTEEVVGAAVRLDDRAGVRVVVASLADGVDVLRVAIADDEPLEVADLAIHDGVRRLALLPPTPRHDTGRTVVDIPISGPGAVTIDLVPGAAGSTGDSQRSRATEGAGDW